MSFKHTIVFALLAFVAIQAATCVRTKQADDRSTINLINKAKQAIGKLTAIIGDTARSAINKLGFLKDSVLNIAKTIVENSKEAIFDEVQQIKEQIEAITEQAAIVGVDIKECLVDSQAALEEIPKKTIAKLLTCVTNVINKAQDIIKKAIEDVKIRDIIGQVPDNLHNCIESSDPMKCLRNLIADVVKAITSVPALITGKMNEMIQLMAHTESDMQDCAIKKVMEASKDAAGIGAKVSKCVSDKIRE